MGNVTKEEYLRLLEQLLDQQYDQSEEEEIVPDYSWMPAEPLAKERMKLANTNGVIDLTKSKKDKIKDSLYKCTNIKVDNFLIRIEKYRGYPDVNQRGQLSMDISVWEERTKTPTGNPCKMTFRMDFTKDTRFTGRPWLAHFNSSGEAHNIPTEVVIDIIRWLQAIKRMTAFL